MTYMVHKHANPKKDDGRWQNGDGIQQRSVQH
jgi:hypothetical protein